MYESKEYSCTDVFALGMLIYFLFTGERPYAGAVDAVHVQRLITDGKQTTWPQQAASAVPGVSETLL